MFPSVWYLKELIVAFNFLKVRASSDKSYNNKKIPNIPKVFTEIITNRTENRTLGY